MTNSYEKNYRAKMDVTTAYFNDPNIVIGKESYRHGEMLNVTYRDTGIQLNVLVRYLYDEAPIRNSLRATKKLLVGRDADAVVNVTDAATEHPKHYWMYANDTVCHILAQ